MPQNQLANFVEIANTAYFRTLLEKETDLAKRAAWAQLLAAADSERAGRIEAARKR